MIFDGAKILEKNPSDNLNERAKKKRRQIISMPKTLAITKTNYNDQVQRLLGKKIFYFSFFKFCHAIFRVDFTMAQNRVNTSINYK